ncbi:MAG: phosphatase PAP2 family protein [Planctomycetes bacterium]|nr:phosphatase PAP2 family protein [Planctomycetota bacterium]
MNELYELVKANGTQPAPAARFYAYSGIALYESCVRGMNTHQSLEGQLQALPDVPEPFNQVYHWPSVVNRCMAVMASSQFPGDQAQIDALEDSFDLTFDATVAAAVRLRSAVYGESVANAILAWAATDGQATLAACGSAFVPPVVDGPWSGTGTGDFPCWSALRPFVVTDAIECRPGQPPFFFTLPTTEWYAEALQIYFLTGDAGASLNPQKIEIANYWDDAPTTTGTPTGHWLGIVGVVTRDIPANNRLDIAAEAFARAGIAAADAFITCWYTKYDKYLQRPVTYIQANIDSDWTPLLAMPNHPTYTSEHATQAAAIAQALTDMFGPTAFVDTTHTDLNPELGYVDRYFDNFLVAAQEAASGRLFAGAHYAFDTSEGFNSGVCVGNVLNAGLQFLK